MASGSGRAGLGVGFKVLVGARVAFLGSVVGSGVGVGARKWSWDWLWVGSGIRVFKVLTEGLPKPQPIGEGTWEGHLRLLLLGLDVLGLGLCRHNLI